MSHITSFSPLGPLEIVSCLHRGALFDVYKVLRDGRERCLKVSHNRLSSTQPGGTQPDAGSLPNHAYISRATGIETSTWGGSTESGIREVTEVPWLSDALLLLEAEKIRLSRGAWNHKVISMGIWDGADDHWKLTPLLAQRRFRSAMLMPMHHGKNIGQLSPIAQRYMWPRMMSSMWRALTDAGHGDLSPTNIILASDMRRFILIDPGVTLWSSTEAGPHIPADTSGQSYMDHGLLMTCNPRYYPLLPPTYTPPPMLGATATLWQHLAWLHQIARFDVRGPVIGTAPVVNRHEGDDALPIQQLKQLLDQHPTGALPSHGAGTHRYPSPADLMAVGIIYYEILSGRHPLFVADEPVIPLWVGTFGEYGRSDMSETYERHCEAWRQGMNVAPPSQHNPEIGPDEDALAMALLRLEIPHFGELVPLVQRACDQTERWGSEAAASMLSTSDEDAEAFSASVG